LGEGVCVYEEVIIIALIEAGMLNDLVFYHNFAPFIFIIAVYTADITIIAGF